MSARRIGIISAMFAVLVAIAPGCSTQKPVTIPIDDILHRSDARGGTFGPTGRRLFTERLDEGMGLRGQFCYIHHSDISDPIRLRLAIDGGSSPWQTHGFDWYPSHVSTRSRQGAIDIIEHKFITEDDVLVDLVRLTNRSSDAVTLKMQLDSGFARHLDRHGSEYARLDLSSVMNAHPWPGRSLFAPGNSVPFRDWYEAEQYADQAGSIDRDGKKAASGGEVLGMHFGGEKGHYASYDIVSPGLPSAYLIVRAAREAGGAASDAVWDVFVDGEKRGHLSVGDTGGWGERAEEFGWFRVELGALGAGAHALRLVATRDHMSTNIDGFFISADAFDPPLAVGPNGAMAEPIEQIICRPGKLVISDVPVDIPDPHALNGRGLVMVDGDGWRWPEEIGFPVERSARADVAHFYGQVCGPLKRLRPGMQIVEYVLHFSDGSSLSQPVALGPEVDRRCLQPTLLSVPIPAGKRLHGIRVRALTAGVATGVLAITLETHPPDGPRQVLAGSGAFFGVTAHGVMAASGFEEAAGVGGQLERTFTIEPGQSVEVPVALGLAETEDAAAARAWSWIGRQDPLAAQANIYRAWFEKNCPVFECDDPFITKLYWYRWFVARHCLSRPATGRLRYPYFFEGTHQRHFPRLIAFSSPHIITEARWLRDPQYAFGQLRNHAANPDETNGFFTTVRADKLGTAYNNWIVKSAWEALWVHPDRTFLAETIDAMGRDVLGTLAEFDRDGDRLPTPENHWHTGMEFQPAFFFFTDYDDTKEEAALERADFAAYLYGGATAVADGYAWLGLDADAKRFQTLAEEIRAACLTKLWDDQDAFCYAIREGDDAVARCREVVGFYPFFSRLFPDDRKYTETLRYLIDPEEFWCAYPPATVTKRCPAYTPKVATWPAKGGRTHGCMWNGPQWPHATSVILEVLATAAQDYDQDIVDHDHFWRMFDRYTHLQFEGDDLLRPMVTEYYDGESGDPDPTGCPDYFHSTYCDLVIRYVAGLQPANDDVLRIRPVPGPLKRFSLRGVRYRGHDVDVVYEGGQDHSARETRGLSVYVDGERVAHREDLGELSYALPAK